jgi:drug/metabolite transporter (DMT)-like permease
MIRVRRSIVELNISVFIMGFTTLFPKLIDLPAPVIVLGRASIALFGLFFYMKFFRKTFNLYFKKDFVLLILSGIFLAFHWITLFASIQLSTVCIGIISFYTYPVITVFLESVVFKTKIGIIDVLIGLMVIVGILLVMPDFDLKDKYTLGVVVGVASAFLGSLRMISSKKLLTTYTGEETMLYQLIITVICLSPLYFFYNTQINNISLAEIGKLTLLGLFFTALPHTLIIRSLVDLRPKTVAILSALQPFYSVIIAFLLLGEKLSRVVLVGGFLIISSVLFETLRKK